MSSHHWPRILVTCWVFTLCVVWNKSASCSTAQSWTFFDSGVGSTGVNMITKNITSELSTTTSPEWHLHENRYVSTDTCDKQGLPETTRPDLIPVMRSNHSEKTQSLIPQDSPRVILFLRLEDTHLRTKGKRVRKDILLWTTDKERPTENTYKWVSVQWKTKI